MAKTETFNGHEIGYERRRYGTTTYTWAHIIKPDGYWEVLGDPWPATRVPRMVLADKIDSHIRAQQHAADEATLADMICDTCDCDPCACCEEDVYDLSTTAEVQAALVEHQMIQRGA